MKVIHNALEQKTDNEPVKKGWFTRFREWLIKRLGANDQPITVMDADTNKPADMQRYKYNVVINTGSGLVKLSFEGISEADVKKNVTTWYVNNKLLVKPELIGAVKVAEGSKAVLWRYACTIQTGCGTFTREIQASSSEKAIENVKVWFLMNKMKVSLSLVGPVTKPANA